MQSLDWLATQGNLCLLISLKAVFLFINNHFKKGDGGMFYLPYQPIRKGKKPEWYKLGEVNVMYEITIYGETVPIVITALYRGPGENNEGTGTGDFIFWNKGNPHQILILHQHEFIKVKKIG